MPRISPQLASALAEDVYALTKQSSKQEALALLNQNYRGSFTFADDNLLAAKTGGPPGFKISTGFGFVLLGKSTSLKGQAFIIFRGTQTLADWLTNGNIDTSRSDSGHLVHDGFHRAFNSMKPRINDFMKVIQQPRHGIHTIHCIGHSLGGALATLCANWLDTKKSTYLYTFGSPRVGLESFAENITGKLSSKRMHRVFHKTDPVPKFLPWPYAHVPSTGTDYYMSSPGTNFSAAYHLMPTYSHSIGKRSWDDIKGEVEDTKTDFGIARWLESKGSYSLTVSVAGWLEQSLVFVLKKCLGSAHTALLGAGVGVVTLIDQLSYILAKSINLADNISKWVLLYIQRIMQVLGMKRSANKLELTRSFIRSILDRLQREMTISTQKALMKIV